MDRLHVGDAQQADSSKLITLEIRYDELVKRLLTFTQKCFNYVITNW